MSGTWMLTASGQDYVLSGPGVLLGNPPLLQDIAHHLAQINRFTGACSRPYSVAEHSLLVERIGARRGASPILRLALLMHDAHEAYTSDLSSPAKIAVGFGWRTFEGAHALNVGHHFGLRTTFVGYRAEITRCDLIALATERRDLMRYRAGHNLDWPILDTPGSEVKPADEHIHPDIPPAHWRLMKEAFLEKYLELRAMLEPAAAAQIGGATP
jgi:hypothetical protein